MFTGNLVCLHPLSDIKQLGITISDPFPNPGIRDLIFIISEFQNHARFDGLSLTSALETVTDWVIAYLARRPISTYSAHVRVMAGTWALMDWSYSVQCRCGSVWSIGRWQLYINAPCARWPASHQTMLIIVACIFCIHDTLHTTTLTRRNDQFTPISRSNVYHFFRQTKLGLHRVDCPSVALEKCFQTPSPFLYSTNLDFCHTLS